MKPLKPKSISFLKGLLLFVLPCVLLSGKSIDSSLQEDKSKFLFNQPALILTCNRIYQIKVNDKVIINIPTEWLVPQKELDEEAHNYVSSFNYLEEVEHFPVNNNQFTGIHISSYDYMKTNGSAFAAAGRDNFLILDKKTGKLFPALIDLGLTKMRLRSNGLQAKASHFYIYDINQDGYKDICIIKEIVQYNNYIQLPPQWHVYDTIKFKWLHNNLFDNKFPEKSQKLKYIEVDESTPVDDLMKILTRDGKIITGSDKYFYLKVNNKK